MAAAIHDPVAAVRLGLDAVPQGDVRHRREAAGQLGRGDPGIEMRLLAEEQRPAEATGEVGFERGDAVGVEPLVFLRGAGEAGEFRQVARGGDEQAAVRLRDRHGLAPVAQREQSEFDELGLGRFRLAPRRDHTAGVERAAVPGGGGALVQRHGKAGDGEGVGGGEAGDAGTEDADARKRCCHDGLQEGAHIATPNPVEPRAVGSFAGEPMPVGAVRTTRRAAMSARPRT